MKLYLGTNKYQNKIDLFYNNVKINCKFKNNICIGSIGNPQSTKEVSCCCGHCATSYGYLHLNFYNNEEYKKLKKYYKKFFDEKLGFYKEGIGCVLERKYRSYICNFYVCSTLLDKMTRKEFVMFEYYKSIIYSSKTF